MGKTKKTKGKSQTSRALNKMDMPEHDPELDQTLGEVEAVLEDAQAAVETAAETIADAAAQTDDPNAQRALDEAAAQTTETASQVSETVAAVAEAAGAVTGTQTSDETTDTESQSGQAQTGEEGSEETMEAETEDEAESPEEGAEDMTGEPAQRLTADDVRAIVMDILEELGVVQRLAAAATAGDLRKSVKSVFKGLSKAARASDVHKLTGDVGRVAVAVEQVLERLNKIEQPSHGPVLREISLLGANGSLASATDIEALEETLQKVSDPVARQVIGQKLTELRIRNAHATGGKNISFNQGA